MSRDIAITKGGTLLEVDWGTSVSRLMNSRKSILKHYSLSFEAGGRSLGGELHTSWG